MKVGKVVLGTVVLGNVDEKLVGKFGVELDRWEREGVGFWLRFGD